VNKICTCRSATVFGFAEARRLKPEARLYAAVFIFSAASSTSSIGPFM
jgi:hypothetical protein